MDDRPAELARYRIEQADEAFRSGKELIKIKDHRGAINRFYYAAFYVTQALLILKGKSARTHSGNLYLFQEEFIRTAVFPEETNRILSGLLEERIESDYAPMSEPTKDEAAKARRDCEQFLKQARKVLNELL